MTDKDIIKALELCKTKDVTDCKECCFRIDEIEINSNCVNELCENALDLINRQKAEIERLKDFCDIYSNEGARAIKEFAERLKEKATSTFFEEHKHVDTEDIDNLLKEMTE